MVLSEPEIVQVDKKKLDTLFIQKQKFREKAETEKTAREKVEQEKIKLEERLKASPPPDYSIIETKVDLRLGGYSPEEISELEAYAKGKGISLKDAVATDFAKAAVERLREVKKSDDATPPPSKAGFSFEGKTWKDMSKDERKKTWEGA
jgi:hypothetical protein